MVWLITKLRRHTIRGIVINTAPLLSSDHGFCKSASLTPAIAFRDSATFLSKSSSSSLLDFGGGGGVIGLPPGARSSESVFTVVPAQPARLAKCPASQIIEPDLSCGFQSNFASGTRS